MSSFVLFSRLRTLTANSQSVPFQPIRIFTVVDDGSVTELSSTIGCSPKYRRRRLPKNPLARPTTTPPVTTVPIELATRSLGAPSRYLACVNDTSASIVSHDAAL